MDKFEKAHKDFFELSHYEAESLRDSTDFVDQCAKLPAPKDAQ